MKNLEIWIFCIFLKFFILCLLIINQFAISSLSAQSLVINEMMASNAATIRDEDGDSPDWIELYNHSGQAINLMGFGLSDNAAEPFKWTFPELSLEPHKFLVVFASGKDRREWLHWETVIDWGDQWRYRLGTSEPPAAWRTVGFDDSGWYQGASGFGYGDNDDATIVPPVISVYVRKSFIIADENAITRALFHVDYDDAFVAYLNGVEIARANIGTPGDPPAYNQPAITYREANMYRGGEPDQFILNDVLSLFRSGKNVLAIQLHNSGINSSDLSLIPFLSIGFTTAVSDSSRGMSPYLNPVVNSLHTNFKINADGEQLTLYHPSGQLVDQLDAGQLPTDVSYGRQPDGSGSWFYFDQATPCRANSTLGYQTFGGEPIFSHPCGFYCQPLLLTLSASSPQAAIYFTLDGSIPSTNSSQYQTPIPIYKTTVVRAKQVVANALPGKIMTQTYFINENISLPVVSLVTDPPNLWDADSGIYVLGKNYEPHPPHFGANFWQDWERPVHVELFEPDGQLGFSLDAGMKIFGGWSRDFAQKSLAIYARSRYGTGRIDYQLFPDKAIDKFEAFILRNSGNDWQSTLCRDAIMQSLVNKTDLDIQAYRPAVVFLNGQYWGILNIREKINEHFLSANRGVDPDSLDLLENDGWIIHGDNSHYRAMLHYIRTRNMQLPQSYQTIQGMMDVDNFLDYQIAQIYFDNTDWPGNNIKFWRPRKPDGRWKWILFDTDFGFGLWDPTAYRNNTLEFATAENGPDWPNPPWSTFLLRKLLENLQFKNDFINRCADHLNTTFRPDRVTQRIDEISKMLAPEIQRHRTKWPQSAYSWHQNVRVLKQFARFRAAYLKAHLISKFDLNGTMQITIDMNPADAGQIQLNSLTLTQFPWQGNYFKGIPIQIEAIPEENYRFAGWSDSSWTDSSTITITPSSDLVITAYFKHSNLSPINESAIPGNKFSLYQNYPNPFNQSTIISYELPEDCRVTLEIFDMLGRKVATLIQTRQFAGPHQIDWNQQPDQNFTAENLSSGVYFYRITAMSNTRTYSDIRKMVYLK